MTWNRQSLNIIPVGELPTAQLQIVETFIVKMNRIQQDYKF